MGCTRDGVKGKSWGKWTRLLETQFFMWECLLRKIHPLSYSIYFEHLVSEQPFLTRWKFFKEKKECGIWNGSGSGDGLDRCRRVYLMAGATIFPPKNKTPRDSEEIEKINDGSLVGVGVILVLFSNSVWSSRSLVIHPVDLFTRTKSILEHYPNTHNRQNLGAILGPCRII